MRKYQFLMSIALSFFLTSCENPLFIKAAKLFKVSFNTNGGTSIEDRRTDRITEIPNTVRENYTFGGWHFRSDLSDSAIQFPLDISEDTTLYAKWYQEFVVTFEVNGGSLIHPIKTGIINNCPETTKNNCEFAGWYTASDFSGSPIEFPYIVTRPTTLYAKWLPTYQATFESNGGSVISPYRAAIIKTEPKAERENYSFIGWYSNSGLTNKVDFPYQLSADTVFYAKWQRIYTVSFATNGGSAVQTVRTGYIESAPVSTKVDASLEGWYLNEELSAESKVQFPYVVTGDVTLYAKWRPVQCTITYYANGATSGTVPATVTVDKGSSYSVLGNTGNLQKNGYAFTKWNTRVDGNGQSYGAGDSLTVTGNMSLYAQWGVDYTSMVTVNGGWFYFGEPSSSERPKITLSSYQIAAYEVTYELWQEVAVWAKDHGYNLTNAKKGCATNDQYKNFVPATKINWNMACVWLNAYSEYKNLDPVYYRNSIIWKDDTNTSGTFTWNKTKNGYRLPTECEWEFAAGGGNHETHDVCKYSGSNKVEDVAWYNGNSKYEMHTVGTKNPNVLNIYDFSGNVQEWCFDSYDSFGTGDLIDPVHDYSYYKNAVHRGGNIYDVYVEIYRRSNAERTYQTTLYGMRPARNAE